ncbi:unnamed protein product [Amoebophrya sp. A120]|nr:unnamed protein product [Amoebophrya sp. A120]|eukprot:GSA120T00004173001.1
MCLQSKVVEIIDLEAHSRGVPMQKCPYGTIAVPAHVVQFSMADESPERKDGVEMLATQAQKLARMLTPEQEYGRDVATIVFFSALLLVWLVVCGVAMAMELVLWNFQLQAGDDDLMTWYEDAAGDTLSRCDSNVSALDCWYTDELESTASDVSGSTTTTTWTHVSHGRWLKQ